VRQDYIEIAVTLGGRGLDSFRLIQRTVSVSL